jgi:hypothetical protein
MIIKLVLSLFLIALALVVVGFVLLLITDGRNHGRYLYL